MMLPASSVRWGPTWSEGSRDGDVFADILKDQREYKSTGTDSEESLWVEIGCSVFKAQLVRNVTHTQ